VFVVIVRFTIRAGDEASFLERVRLQAADSLRHEAACRRFDVCVDPQDRRRVLLYEMYASAASFDEHLRTPHFLAFDAESREWIQDKTVERWSLAAAD
jgi:quinol monooxygenase YgiN